jgi:hypothetical protein
MKKIITPIVLFFTIIGQFAFAQPMMELDQIGEKYYAQKIAYLTSAMQLTPDESAAFWPVYNECERKKAIINDQMKDKRREAMTKGNSITEEEALQTLRFFQQHMTDMHQLELEYQDKYLKVISAKKVLLLLKGEKDFKRDLLKQLGDRRRNRNN